MTPRDMFFSTPSGITIKNVSTTNPITLSGVYIQTLYSTNGPIVANYGSAFGALWSNVTLGTSAPTNTTTIGANFLYNMIMNYGYQSGFAFSPPVLSNVVTPGTTTSGTGPWLLFLGVTKGAPVTPTSNISGTLGTGNDLVYIAQITTSYSQQLCVTCSDATQTCTYTTNTTSCYHGYTTSSPVQNVPCNLDSSANCAPGVYPPN